MLIFRRMAFIAASIFRYPFEQYDGFLCALYNTTRWSYSIAYSNLYRDIMYHCLTGFGITCIWTNENSLLVFFTIDRNALEVFCSTLNTTVRLLCTPHNKLKWNSGKKRITQIKTHLKWFSSIKVIKSCSFRSQVYEFICIPQTSSILNISRLENAYHI